MSEPSEKNENQGKLVDLVKDLTSTGLATFFMTEDAVRAYLKERKLPKELIGSFLEGLSKKKEDIVGQASQEISRWLSKVDLSKELTRFLEKHSVKVQAEIHFEPRKKKETSDEEKPTNG